MAHLGVRRKRMSSWLSFTEFVICSVDCSDPLNSGSHAQKQLRWLHGKAMLPSVPGCRVSGGCCPFVSAG